MKTLKTSSLFCTAATLIVLSLPSSVLAEHKDPEPQKTSHSKHQQMDHSQHHEGSHGKHQQMDHSQHQGMDHSEHKNMDHSQHTDNKKHDGAGHDHH